MFSKRILKLPRDRSLTLLLLEDHFNVKYPYGYISYIGSKRRYKIKITLTLRSNVKKCFREIKSYMNSNKIPKRQNDENFCRNCSYRDFCLCE